MSSPHPLNLFADHPPALRVLFFTEMWERFSYYGMRALLVLYLTQGVLISSQNSLLIYGAYTSLVYLLPILGGIIADRYLGKAKAVVVGAAFMFCGHLLLLLDHTNQVPPDTASGALAMMVDPLFVALSLIVMGVGYLKPNITALVGALYQLHDPRRESGFSLFYMGINFGGLISPLICGYLGQAYGWRYGFGVASLGILLGLILFLRNYRLVQESSGNEARATLRWSGEDGRILGLSVLAVLIIAWLLQNQAAVGQLLAVCSGAILLYIARVLIVECDREQRQRLIALCCLICFSVLFWSLTEQAGGSLTLLTDRFVDRHLFGYEIPTASFIALNPFLMVLGLPLMNVLWARLEARGKNPSTPVKFFIGVFLLAIGFFAIPMGIQMMGDGQSMSLLWIFLIYLFMALGDCVFGPAGLSAVTKLSLPRIVGMMAGVWFLSMSLGSYLAGVIGAVIFTDQAAQMPQSATHLLASYTSVYTSLALFGIAASLVILALSPLLRKWMHGVR